MLVKHSKFLILKTSLRIVAVDYCTIFVLALRYSCLAKHVFFLFLILSSSTPYSHVQDLS